MPETQKIPEPKRLNDPDMRGAEKALYRAALKARVFAAPLGAISLLPSEMGTHAGLVGAACLVAQSRQ